MEKIMMRRRRPCSNDFSRSIRSKKAVTVSLKKELPAATSARESSRERLLSALKCLARITCFSVRLTRIVSFLQHKILSLPRRTHSTFLDSCLREARNWLTRCVKAQNRSKNRTSKTTCWIRCLVAHPWRKQQQRGEAPMHQQRQDQTSSRYLQSPLVMNSSTRRRRIKKRLNLSLQRRKSRSMPLPSLPSKIG